MKKMWDPGREGISGDTVYGGGHDSVKTKKYGSHPRTFLTTGKNSTLGIKRPVFVVISSGESECSSKKSDKFFKSLLINVDIRKS